MSDLQINDLSIEYDTDSGPLQAVNQVSLELEPGEILGIVGESGSGKSTVAESIIRILDVNGRITAGEIEFDGTELTGLSEAELGETVRGSRIGMMFQDPHTSTSPVNTVGTQIADLLMTHHDISRSDARDRAIELLKDVGIASAALRYDEYPHSFSGGMLQRVLLAMAIAGEPEVLIADEPTTGLDMTIQAQVLSKLETLNEDRNMSILLITHDLDVVRDICDRVVVMYNGNVVEAGTCESVIDDPKHPYTADLTRLSLGEVLSESTGTPDLIKSAANTGCPYHNTCSEAIEGVCNTGGIPKLYESDDGRPVRCHLYDPQQQEGKQ